MATRSTSRGPCRACRDPQALGFDFSMAFQPIVDVSEARVFAYEALARGPQGEGAASVLAQVTDENRYAFDQAARVKAIDWAHRLAMDPPVSINFMPNAVYNPLACIQRTLDAARRTQWPTERIIFEVSESEAVGDRAHLVDIFRSYREYGFKTAIDDFGAGHSGLGLLADFQPDFLKLDMGLIRDLPARPAASAIVRHVVALAADLGVTVIAEGIERREESDALVELGVRLQQGYRFARPAFQALPDVHWMD